jgi:hypothetical protein
MLFTLSSSLRFSLSILASVSSVDVLVGALAPPPGSPEDWAVPSVLVPGGGLGAFLISPFGDEPDGFARPVVVPAPKFEALPAAFAAPAGAPLDPVVPAAAEPAFEEPAALLAPADELLAPPPVEPPLLPPCA